VIHVEIGNRIDVAGGYSDIDPTRPGAVVSIPALINNSPIGVTASVGDGPPDGLSVRLNGQPADGLITRIVRSVAEWVGVRGSATVEIDCSTPAGAGVGGSSQITAAALAALARCEGMTLPREGIAIQAFKIERPLTSAGWQDQAPLVIGRCGYIAASPAPDPDAVHPTYHPLPVSEALLRTLERRGLLVWTGRSHVGKELLDDVKARLGRGEPRALEARDALYALARQARDLLLEGGPAEALVSRLAAIVLANWAAEIKLTAGAVTTDGLAAIEPLLLRLGGFKLLGAGCGGFLFFIGDSKEATAVAAESLRTVAGWEVTPWRIDRRPARIVSL
jgi:galactokinase/mevalonate kinase-like predicted kinase